MTLRDMISTDATRVFLNASEFAESVTYLPYRYAGEALRESRTILAVVEREDNEADEAGAPVAAFFVRVHNDATTGLGGDRIALPPRDGKSPETKVIVRVTEQDNGMMVLRCQ
jgi:hypothetical protein